MAFTGMILKRAGQVLAMVVVGCVINSCVEAYEPQTGIFESALVIEATITNELKQHEILLGRTFRFEENRPELETNADVMVKDDAQNEYIFQETSPGRYVSAISFNAEPNRDYQLQITTNDGRTYLSETVQLTNAISIGDLYAERIINDDNVEGMAIFVDSFDPTNGSKFYRYEYGETYKIIAPKWNSIALTGDPDPENPCGLLLIRNPRDERVCYTTDFSNSIILTDTKDLDEDRVARFPVRFINRDNYILSHRYSILVRQFVQSNKAHTYFETLRDFSGSESLFSETQPGFLRGNIFSEGDKNEKVIGYFEVASVSEKRIFFNYDDFFPSEDLPPYVSACEEVAPLLINDAGNCILRFFVDDNAVRYVNENVNPGFEEGPFLVVPRVCGDCTVLGETEIPEFWIE